ncbi:MAG TPA: glycogen-binding domain-containing protein [Gemmatimonadales bacterium]|nr:glycogen-binding domain-containing protein [Gemmatimonadales bacterium]
MMPASWRGALLAGLALLVMPAAAWSQEWRASARFGRVAYEGAPAGNSASSSAVLGLGRTGSSDWIGASAALPLSEDPFWAVLGGWTRAGGRGAAGLLLDATGHGFVQRASATSTPAPSPFPVPSQPPVPVESDLSGEGAGGELMVGAFAAGRAVRVEARGGVAAQRSRLGGVVQGRAIPTGDIRLSFPLTPISLGAESRAWADDGVTHTYLGGTLGWARGPVQLWGSIGRWVSGGLDRTAWSAGAGAEVAPGLELQAGGRGNAFDPLYLSATGSSVWTGISLRVGGGRAVRAPVPVRTRDGASVIAIPARSSSGAPSVAGDFTGWKPVPMQREGSRWTYTTRLAPGVYHYAFVAEDGSWFVPESVAGRQDDGMGGHVAVLVVP